MITDLNKHQQFQSTVMSKIILKVFNLIQRTQKMSKNYHTTTQPFPITESKVRHIVQTQLQDFFSCIKDQIENKIKQIDRNIFELKATVKDISSTNKCNKCDQYDHVMQKIREMNVKMEEIQKIREKDMERLMEQIRNKTIDRSYEKRQDRSPLFRKSNTAPSLDLNNIIFGEENVKANMNSQTVKEKQKPHDEIKLTVIPKPPLPKPKNQYKIPQPKPLQSYIPNNPNNHQPQIQEFQNPKHTDITDPQHQQPEPNNIIVQNLNRNKNSFMRKKSLKKFSTIHEEQVEQSMLSTS